MIDGETDKWSKVKVQELRDREMISHNQDMCITSAPQAPATFEKEGADHRRQRLGRT